MSESEIHHLLSQALNADENGDPEKALNCYTEAVEKILKIKDLTIRQRLDKYAVLALDRAEDLKNVQKKDQKNTTQTTTATTAGNQFKFQPTQTVKNASGLSSPVAPTPTNTTPTALDSSAPKLGVSGSQMLTDEEKHVLEYTSRINDNIFVPFMSIDVKDKFIYTIPYTDKDGLLTLAPKQKQRFFEWRRIGEIVENPQIVSGKMVDFYSIKQTVISDCSFVASLAVSALYEKRFGKRLITSIIYPRNSKDEPIVNPSGKYSVKLHINGIPRKVIIDDYLPVTRNNELLCSYSNNRNEFWVSLLEKAYMKVMGGYEFPGSNSSIDLNALTGWIPERIAINDRTGYSFNSEAVFDRLKAGLESGRCLITVATGSLSDDEEKRTGLVETHAYAVLDLQEIEGVKLLKLKNPWSHLRWKGNYSELDATHWTKSLQAQLNYDPEMAEKVDNGVFWIDYVSILRFFDVFYINWNPGLFQYTYCFHQQWSAGTGPAKDSYTVGDNPQYKLSVGAGTGSLWILLSRHITTIDDFRENKEYITLLVYQNNGKKIYYPYDPAPYIDGVRINSPHYLCKIKLDPNQAKNYTLVISQYEKCTTIYYTLRAYCRNPFELKQIGMHNVKERISGEWKGTTAGGCPNHMETYRFNPKYRIQLGPMENSNLVIELRGPREYQIGIDVRVESLSDPTVTAPFVSKSSGNYRSGFCVLDLYDLPSGIYHVIPSTFLPNQESPFILDFQATTGIKIEQIKV